jgi:hypothetical protein
MITKTSWERLREIVKNRDNELCQYCYKYAPDGEDGEVDHILPLAQGGTDGIDNLVWACRECNQLKSSKTLREWITILADRALELEGAIWSGFELSLSDRIDWGAAGWSCDCGGCAHLKSGIFFGGIYGYHKENCPIVRLKDDITPGYYPGESRIVGGRAELFSVAIILGAGYGEPGEEKYLLSRDCLDTFEKLVAGLTVRRLESGEVEL